MSYDEKKYGKIALRGKSHGKPDKGESAKTAKKEHPGFEAVENKIVAKQGVSEERAGAILASASRHASPKAKSKNPNLKKIKG